MPSFVNEYGVRYYLPEFGPPAHWSMTVAREGVHDAIAALRYFECDAENKCRRAIYIRRDGRVTLAYPGGPHGDLLPESTIEPNSVSDVSAEFSSRDVGEVEFNALWAAFGTGNQFVPPNEVEPDLVDTGRLTNPSFEEFHGTWVPDEPTGMTETLLLTMNGLVIWKKPSETEFFTYVVDGGFAFFFKNDLKLADAWLEDATLVVAHAANLVKRFRLGA